MQNYKRDIILSLICGGVTALFLLLVIKNPYITEFQSLAKIADLAWFLLAALPTIFFIGILVGKFLEKFTAIIFQIVKFGEVGVLNTFVDAGILNFLIGASGITAGVWLAPLNTVSFLFAMTNSYLWNKFWTFRDGGQATGLPASAAPKALQAGKNFLQFLVVSGIGWGINTGILVLVTSLVSPLFSLSAGAWANVAKLGAIFVSMVWNFLGYKFFVFKKNNG